MEEKIFQLIFNSIDELNEQLLNDIQLQKSKETILFGENGQLDSLALVNLIVIIEQNIEDELNVSITIADEKAMSQKHSPFKTVETLMNYIQTLLKDELND